MTPEHFYQGGDPNDIRFQFEIVKHLAESVRDQTIAIGKVSAQNTEMLVRLERIEAKETAENVTVLAHRVDKLEAEKHRREGASNVAAWIFKSPLLAWLGLAAMAVYAVFVKGDVK